MEAWVSLQVRKADAYQFSLAERQIDAHVRDPQRPEADLRAMERHNDAAHKAYAVALRAEASADALAERTAARPDVVPDGFCPTCGQQEGGTVTEFNQLGQCAFCISLTTTMRRS